MPSNSRRSPVSLQHHSRRRSLIDDARFDTLTNAEFEKSERDRETRVTDVRTSRDVSDEEEDVFTTVNGGDPASPRPIRKYSLVCSLREVSVLGRLLKIFEVAHET